MPLRVIEVVTPRVDKEEVLKSLEEHKPEAGYVYWATPLDDDSAVSFRMVLDVQDSEDVLDKLERLFSWTDKYRIVVFAAEATIPRLAGLEKKEEQPESGETENNKKNRLSREELYADVLDTSVMTGNYLMLVFLASVVAVIGLARDSVAVIIGAMVLAPLLGPNVGLCLATTLGDAKLARESLKTLVSGVGLALAVSTVAGLVVPLPEGSAELLSRGVVSYSDMILAIVSGAAGIISFNMGVAASMVGVMVSLSLLPPLAACGMYLGAGHMHQAVAAGILFLANVICLNLAGVVTFLVQGVRPLTWWEREKARARAYRIAVVWAGLALALACILYFKLVG